MPLHPNGRVCHTAHIIRPKVIHRTREHREGSRPRTKLEIDETALQGQKWTDRVMTSYNLEAPQSVENLEVTIRYSKGAGVTHAMLCESLVEVVTHLPFKHHVGK